MEAHVLKGLTSFWIWTGAIAVLLWTVISILSGAQLDEQATIGLVVIVAAGVFVTRKLASSLNRRKEGVREAPKPES